MFTKILKLIRFQNLLIVAGTQYLMRFAIIKPLLAQHNYSLQFSEFNFFLLVLATVLLTAGGYVINDYFDTKTDLVNRPETVIVGKFISRRTAMIIHIILNVIAVLLGFYISYKIGIYQLGFIFLLITGILWYYSSSYKRQFLIGNIIVAILTALVPLMTVVYEIPVLNIEYKDLLISRNSNFYHLFFWVLGFSAFAFITNLYREIIKDIEDVEGDDIYGRNTLPIVIGTKFSKLIVVLLIAFTILLMYFIWMKYIKDTLSVIYISIALTLPQLFLIYKVIKASKKEDYKLADLLSKIIMLLGVLYSLIANYNFTKFF